MPAHWSRALTAAAILTLLITAAPAAAWEGTHVAGEQVSYPLVFPVGGNASAGSRTHYWDSRASGLHHAQDIMAPKMTPVYAVASGTIQYVNWSRDPANPNPARCCSLVLVHDDGWETWYIHLNNDTAGTDDGLGWGVAPGIAVGVHVGAGTVIGWVGDSGNAESTSPHLHFELRDPADVIVDAFLALRAAQGLSTPPPTPPPTTTTTVAAASTTTTTLAGQSPATTTTTAPAAPPTTAAPAPRATPPPPQATTTTTVAPPPPTCTQGSARALAALLANTRTLRRGSSGPAVYELEGFLTLGGFRPGTVDDTFSGSTYQAVRRFQISARLRADGLVGPRTRAAILRAVSQPGPASMIEPTGQELGLGSTGPQVLELKRWLRAAGFGTATADGAFDPTTEAAVRAFQAALLGSESGVVDLATRAALAKAISLTWPGTCSG